MKKIIAFFVKEKVFSFFVLVFILTSILTRSFLTSGNMTNLLTQVGLYGIASLGMTFAIIGGEFDLCVGSMISLSSVLVVSLYPRFGLLIASILTIFIGILLGLINGLLVAKAKINSFIVTFGSMVTLKGLALTVAKGVPVPSKSQTLNEIGTLNIFGVSFVFVVFIVLLLICHFILSSTIFGRNIYAVGGNPVVAQTSGISLAFYKTALFVLTLLFASITGLFFAARINSGHPTIGDDSQLTMIAAVVIGGTSLVGGKGNVIRTLLGIFVMMLLPNSFDNLVIQPYFQRIIKGAIIVIVVAFDSYNKKKIAAKSPIS
jgi:ribose/xylose/arabinose/galactoside ABC-type transport system permease subunit